jgi:hypothetical protein
MALHQHVNFPNAGSVVDPELSRRRLALVAQAAERLLAANDPAGMVSDQFALSKAELRLDVIFNHRPEGDRLVLEAFGLLKVAVEQGVAVSGTSDASLPIEQGGPLALLVHSLLVEGSSGAETVSIQMVERAGTTWTEVNGAGCECTSRTLAERRPRGAASAAWRQRDRRRRRAFGSLAGGPE